MASYAIPKRAGLCLDSYGFVSTKDIVAFNQWLSRVTFSGVPAGSVVVDESKLIGENDDYWDVPFRVLLPFPKGDL